MARVPIERARGEELLYLSGLRDGHVLFQVCDDCGAAVWYLRTVCPVCMGVSLHERVSAGTGVVHTFTTLHRAGHPARASEVPYTVALVDLDEGVRVIGDLVGGARIGDRVHARVEPDGLVFEPEAPAGATRDASAGATRDASAGATREASGTSRPTGAAR